MTSSDQNDNNAHESDRMKAVSRDSSQSWNGRRRKAFRSFDIAQPNGPVNSLISCIIAIEPKFS